MGAVQAGTNDAVAAILEATNSINGIAAPSSSGGAGGTVMDASKALVA